MKKITALVAIIFIIGKVYSQGPIFGYDQGNILYRGYKNKVEFGTSDGRPFEIFIEDGKLISDTIVNEQRETDSIVYYLMPYGLKTTKVLFLNPITKEPFDTIVFNILSIPDPSLYWGVAKDGEKGSRSATGLFAKYPPEIYLNASFRITTWELYIPGAAGPPIFGAGNTLDETAMSSLRLAKPGSSISLITTVAGPDGIQRKIAGVFVLY